MKETTFRKTFASFETIYQYAVLYQLSLLISSEDLCKVMYFLLIKIANEKKSSTKIRKYCKGGVQVISESLSKVHFLVMSDLIWSGLKTCLTQLRWHQECAFVGIVHLLRVKVLVFALKHLMSRQNHFHQENYIFFYVKTLVFTLECLLDTLPLSLS